MRTREKQTVEESQPSLKLAPSQPNSMPGTILVSVLDLMDLPSTPSPASSNLFTLKVAMGKREFETTGNGSFAFPLTSLRDKLIVMLHDTQGSEISRIEFKTISVVEKEFWDDFFPLDGGGRVHLKLEFSLSEGERNRIREMREGALRRKQEKLVKGDLKSSPSGAKTGAFTQFVYAEHNNTYGALLDQLEQTNPDPELWFENSFMQNSSHPTEAEKETVKSQSVFHVECSGSTVSENVTKDKCSTSADLNEEQTHSPERKISSEINFKNNVKKMINACESGISQGIEPHLGSKTKFHLDNMTMNSSLKKAFFEESDVTKETVPLRMARSFSAGMLSEFNLGQSQKTFRSPFVKQEEVQHFDHVTDGKTTDKKPQLSNSNGNQNPKNLDSHKQKAAVDVKGSYKESTDASQVDIANVRDVQGATEADAAVRYGSAEQVGERKDPVSHGRYVQRAVRTEAVIRYGSGDQVSRLKNPFSFEVKKNSSVISKCRDHNALQQKIEIVQFPKADHITCTSVGTSDSLPSSHDGEEIENLGPKQGLTDEMNPSNGKKDDANGSIRIVQDKDKKHKQATLVGAHLSSTMIGETKNLDWPCSLSMRAQGDTLNAVLKERDYRSYGSNLDAKIDSETSSITMELITFSDSSMCLFGSLATWTPQHLCITTGNKQLRDFVGCCNIPMQQRKLGNPSIEAEEDRKIFHCSESSNIKKQMGISKWNGSLIEQGVRIFILIVACGTLFLSSRQRNPR